jgi:1,4-dihydroxy-2-naphthoate octaprenyltransferase
MFLHLGTNIANDYFDHKSGNDEINKEFVRPFSGGSRMIQLGLLTPRKVLASALVFFTMAFLIGLYLTWARGLFVLALGLIGLVSGIFYTGAPFNWASKGIGEALVGINFGALMTLGAYYVQTRILSIEPIIASIPISLLIAAVLYINEFPDYSADKAVGKNTLVVRLGRNRAVLGYMLIVASSYVIVFLNVLFGIAPLYTLFALIPLPLALRAIRLASKFHSEPLKLAPANTLTIVFHLLTSLLISFGYLSYRFETTSPSYFIAIVAVGICALMTIYFYLKTKTPNASRNGN